MQTDPNSQAWDIQRTPMMHPVSAAPLATVCTTQDYMHTDRLPRLSLNHHITVTKDCSGVVPDCHGVTQNGRESSSVTSPAFILVETTLNPFVEEPCTQTHYIPQSPSVQGLYTAVLKGTAAPRRRCGRAVLLGRRIKLEHPHTVPADGAVGVGVEGHQVFWTCDNKPFVLVLTTVPPHIASPPRLKRDSSLKMTRCHSESLHESLDISFRVMGTEQFLDGPFLFLHTSAQSKLHKDMDERVWCGGTGLGPPQSRYDVGGGQCSVGHPVVLHQWSKNAATGCCLHDDAHRTPPTGHWLRYAAHRTPPTGHCPQDATYRTLPTGHRPQDATYRTLATVRHHVQDTGYGTPPHRTPPTGHRLQDTAVWTPATGRRPQDTGHRTPATGHRPQDTAHRTLPTGRHPQDTGQWTLSADDLEPRNGLRTEASKYKGLITTTSRKLDREQQAEHFLEVTVTDGSDASRQSTVWVIVHVQDENDNKPEFPETVYRISLPERDRNKRGDPVYRVFASDRDEGPNAELTYSIVEGNDDGKFFIDAKTAMVSSRKMVTAGGYDILTIKATDNGSPQKWSTARLHIEWIRKPLPSLQALRFSAPSFNFTVPESAKVSESLGIVSVRPIDTPLWFDIIGDISMIQVSPSQRRALSLYLTDPTTTITDIQRAVVSSMIHPVSATPLADGCTTQDYMHTDRYHDCP
ncbi:hypothetical protein NFI96_005361 [Prochilodus magdalenae]|nr:hypothetical protein NFI96_005361 [Prochilodus magdalenae]